MGNTAFYDSAIDSLIGGSLLIEYMIGLRRCNDTSCLLIIILDDHDYDYKLVDRGHSL